MAQRSRQDIDTSIDNTILNPLTNEGAYYKVFWEKSDQCDVGEWGHVYRISYILNFG